MQENLLIDWLMRNTDSHPAVSLGIGDDAAVLSSNGRPLVITTDLICDGVHFRCEDCVPEQIGYKAVAVNLSDLAGMAAEPVAAFVSLLLPEKLEQQYARRLMDGVSQLASEFDMALAGGDTNVWGGALAINVTAVGRVTSNGPLLRSGARPGDALLVTGALGGSLLGHHLTFQPRVREALLLNQQYDLSAGMDLSDGLAMDLRRLTSASGCGAEIVAEQIPVSAAARQLGQSAEDVILHALGDGEDFELLLCVPPMEAERMLKSQPLDVPLTGIGHCTNPPELWLLQDGKKRPLPQLGYEHGADAPGRQFH